MNKELEELASWLKVQIDFCATRENEIKDDAEKKGISWCNNTERLELVAERCAYADTLNMLEQISKPPNSSGEL